jgi:hypothetical protein
VRRPGAVVTEAESRLTGVLEYLRPIRLAGKACHSYCTAAPSPLPYLPRPFSRSGRRGACARGAPAPARLARGGIGSP